MGLDHRKACTNTGQRKHKRHGNTYMPPVRFEPSSWRLYAHYTARPVSPVLWAGRVIKGKVPLRITFKSFKSVNGHWVLIFYALIDKERTIRAIRVSRLEEAMSNRGNVARGLGDLRFSETVMTGGLVVHDMQWYWKRIYLYIVMIAIIFVCGDISWMWSETK